MHRESAALSGLEALESGTRVKSHETFNHAATLTNLEYREIRFYLFQSPLEFSLFSTCSPIASVFQHRQLRFVLQLFNTAI